MTNLGFIRALGTFSTNVPIDGSELSASLLINRLSFTHFRLLLEIDDLLKRAFYEVESIKGNWSVRELRRQIASLYFERSGLSRDKTRLAEIANAVAAEWEDLKAREVFDTLGFKVCDFSTSVSKTGSGDVWMSYVLDKSG